MKSDINGTSQCKAGTEHIEISALSACAEYLDEIRSGNRIYKTYPSGTFFQGFKSRYLREKDDTYSKYCTESAYENGMRIITNTYIKKGVLVDKHESESLCVEKIAFDGEVAIVVNGLEKSDKLSRLLTNCVCLDHQLGLFGLATADLRFEHCFSGKKICVKKRDYADPSFPAEKIWREYISRVKIIRDAVSR